MRGIILLSNVRFMYKTVVIYFMILCLTGCGYIRYSSELLTLKGAGDSKKEIEQYVQQREELFNLLLQEVKADRLKIGTPRETILETYGDPIFSKDSNEIKDSQDVSLYRRPVNYFDSDRIYLYFNSKNSLVHIKLLLYNDKKVE